MATVSYTLVPSTTLSLTMVKWLALTTTNADGAAIGLQDYQDRTVQVTGTLGTGGHLLIQGSNDGGATWNTLTDPLGNALDFTSALTGDKGMKQITELPALIRPFVSAGDGTTSLNVYLHMRGRDQ